MRRFLMVALAALVLSPLCVPGLYAQGGGGSGAANLAAANKAAEECAQS